MVGVEMQVYPREGAGAAGGYSLAIMPHVKSRGVPRMKVDSDNSPLNDIIKWKEMYQNRFFNPQGRIITGEDVSEVLAYQDNNIGSPFSGLDNTYHHQLKTKLRPRHFPPINQRAHAHKISLDLNRVVPPRIIARKKSSSLEKLIPRKKESCELPKNDSEPQCDKLTSSTTIISSPIMKKSPISSTHTSKHSIDSYYFEDVDLPSDDHLDVGCRLVTDHRPLRRYRLRLPPVGKPVKRCNIDGAQVDAWCPWNYVTYEDNAPFTPNSFYVHNYPLLLMRIPKRSEDEQETDNSWRPVSSTPDVDLSYFDRLPTRELSWDSFSDSTESDTEASSKE